MSFSTKVSGSQGALPSGKEQKEHEMILQKKEINWENLKYVYLFKRKFELQNSGCYLFAYVKFQKCSGAELNSLLFTPLVHKSVTGWKKRNQLNLFYF